MSRRPKGSIPVHQHEFTAVMALAIHMLPECNDNLTAAWAAACVRYSDAVKMASLHGIPAPCGPGEVQRYVHVDEAGFYVTRDQ